jgi:hypothetical protein
MTRVRQNEPCCALKIEADVATRHLKTCSYIAHVSGIRDNRKEFKLGHYLEIRSTFSSSENPAPWIDAKVESCLKLALRESFLRTNHHRIQTLSVTIVSKIDILIGPTPGEPEKVSVTDQTAPSVSHDCAIPP